MRRSDTADEGSGESSNNGSIHRRPFLSTLGVLGATAGMSGLVGAQEGSEWPDVDDSYYQFLVDDLAERGLPAAEFVFGDSESAVRDQFWASAGDFGTTESISVVGDGVPFSEATRFDVTDEPENNWDVQFRTAEWASDPYRSVEAGDVMLGVAYLRAPDGEGTATAQYVVDNPNSDGWNDVASADYQQPPGEWQRYFFPIEIGAAADGSEYEWSVQFHLGFDVQTVDVGGLAVFDFGQDVAVDDLPSGAVSDDYEGGDEPTVYDSWSDPEDEYYAELVDELSSLDSISPGRFVYAANEADTFDAYEVAGSNADLAEREAIDIGDDVPFTEATRVEVGELEDEDASLDPWGVTFQAPVDERDIAAGSTLLGVAYLRNPGTGGSTADVTYKATEEGDTAANYALNGGVAVGTEWERYFFPVNFGASGDAGEWWTEFWLGVEGQTVDIGGVALLDFAQGVDATQLPSWDDELDLDENWEEAADQRIQENRTADLTVTVTDENGDPVEADVDLEMQEHDFTFGTAVDANRVLEDSEDAERYREHITDLYNTVVLENHHKWRFFEENQETADEATEWLLEQDLDMRGHVAIWGSRDSYAVPADVEDALDAGDAETVRQRSQEHIETIIDHYGDDIKQWDVVNEVIHEPELIEVIDGEDVDPVTAPMLAEWYRTATDVAPEGVELDMNDYNVLVGPYEGTRDDYERQIEFLANAEGVDLGGIGMQSHFSRSSRLTPTQIMSALDRYAEAGNGADLRITEFDMGDPNWLEADKAEFFHWFLKTIYSHPDVGDFMMWGFWDADHWEDDAPLFYEDWEKKPSHDVYTDLVFDEWWTEESGTTDENGEFTANAFLGEYKLTVSTDRGEVETTLSIDEPTDQSIDVSLVGVDVHGATDKPHGPIPVHVRGDADVLGDLDYDTVRFGTPEVVNSGGGSDVMFQPGANGFWDRDGDGDDENGKNKDGHPGRGFGKGKNGHPGRGSGKGNGKHKSRGFGKKKDDHPVFGEGKDDHPVFGGDKDDHPAFGGDKDDHPVFGGDEGDHPVFGGDEGDHPVFGGDEGDHPVFGGDEGDHPVFGGDEDDHPVFGGDEDDHPAFGGDKDDFDGTQWWNRSQLLFFDAEETDLEGDVAMLAGLTEDGTIVVGFDQL